MPVVKPVSSFSSWTTETPQNSYVERVMDNAAYSAAHPDDTIVLVGPPRYAGVEWNNLVPVGMLQSFGINQTRPFQPVMAIGSGRQFFLGGKAQGSATIGRLFVNAQSLMRRLYANFADMDGALGGDSGALKFQEPPGASDSFYINLDSELFLIPFGLGVVFSDKSRHIIGALYLELCVMPSYSIGVAAGQAMILESVNILFDRIVPMQPTQVNSMFDSWNNQFKSGMDSAAKDTYTGYFKEGTFPSAGT